MILLSDPVIAAVEVHDDGTPLVDVRELGFAVDPEIAAANPWRMYLRADVAHRLRVAATALPTGWTLLIAEGYRPLELQRGYFAEYRDELARREPDRSEQWWHREASRYISPPEVAPHCTGGAVDLTVCGPDGRQLDMGTAVNASPVDSANRCYTAAPDLSPTAREHRDVLVAALTGAGLVNYPTEWWHWSFGERYWAHTSGTPARYGPIPPPSVR